MPTHTIQCLIKCISIPLHPPLHSVSRATRPLIKLKNLFSMSCWLLICIMQLFKWIHSLHITMSKMSSTCIFIGMRCINTAAGVLYNIFTCENAWGCWCKDLALFMATTVPSDHFTALGQLLYAVPKAGNGRFLHKASVTISSNYYL